MLACLLLFSGLFFLGTLCAAGLRRSRFLDIHPQYRPLLAKQGLTTVEQFLELPAVIISGHRHRNVAQVTLATDAGALHAYLKREVSIPWRDYLANALAGFGFVSRSYREALTLRVARRGGIGCPELIAAGEDGKGRAFLLVRALAGTCELRDYLRQRNLTNPGERRVFARDLGQALARLHAAGFQHADLHSTHIFVNPRDNSFHFLDWQRATRRRRLNRRQSLHDLATLDATLAGELASEHERLACLRAYLQASGRTRARAAAQVRRQAVRLLQKRHIREVRHSALAVGIQNLIWLEGEALCVTREFQAELNGRIPDWLTPSRRLETRSCRPTEERISIRGMRAAVLVRRWSSEPGRWLWCLLLNRPFVSPEFQRAALLFRLQRFGVATPRLLAVGQQHPRPWQSESFLLTDTE